MPDARRLVLVAALALAGACAPAEYRSLPDLSQGAPTEVPDILPLDGCCPRPKPSPPSPPMQTPRWPRATLPCKPAPRSLPPPPSRPTLLATPATCKTAPAPCAAAPRACAPSNSAPVARRAGRATPRQHRSPFINARHSSPFLGAAQGQCTRPPGPCPWGAPLPCQGFCPVRCPPRATPWLNARALATVAPMGRSR